MRLKGWAYDPNNPSESIVVHCYVGGNPGDPNAERLVVETDLLREDVNEAYGITGKHGFDVVLPTSKYGQQTIYAWAIGTIRDNNASFGSLTTSITRDAEAPVITDVKISDVAVTGYTVSCKVTDNVDVRYVSFPTWTRKNGQDDIATGGDHYDAVVGVRDGVNWSFRVNSTDHNGELGDYITHIYAWDYAGNKSVVGDEDHFIVDASCRGDHDWNEWVVDVEATCTGTGSRHRLCKVCDTREDEEVPALGHDLLEPQRQDVVAATCEVDGSYESVSVCGRCGEEINRERVTVDKLGHSPAEPMEANRIEPTCSKAGSYDSVIYCSRCGEELSREAKTLPKADHDPAEPVEENHIEPTCKKVGSHDMVPTARCVARRSPVRSLSFPQLSTRGTKAPSRQIPPVQSRVC